MRAKFRVTKVTKTSDTSEQLEMMAVSSTPFDGDGKSEDNDFARWTPSGQLTMTINNPALIGHYKEGDAYYIDFTPAT